MLPTPNPTLIIGLGGTGQWVTTHTAHELKSLYGVASITDLDPRVQILAVDTDFRREAVIDDKTVDDMGEVTLGQVTLPKPNLVPIGENVKAFVELIDQRQRPESCSWLDAKWFLEKARSKTLLDLTKGAGQYRPLGRLAVPYNLTQGGKQLRTKLQNAIKTIKSHMVDGDKLVVCITGSLCGGTGAGMIIDVAHLVQMLAAPTVVYTRGYLVLPAAFEGTAPDSEENPDAFGRRAFAAMRELRRFSREVKYKNGYPMYYEEATNSTGDPVLRGRQHETLFELLYYFDTPLQRTVKVDDNARPFGQVKLEKTPVSDGIAPLIAEAILMWVDGRTSDQLLSHSANLEANKDARVAGNILNAQAAVAGGMGVYSLYLPLDLIIKEWTYTLGREVLKDFMGVPPENGEDEISKTVTYLRDNWAGGAVGASGTVAARSEWKKGTVAGLGVSTLVRDHLTTGLAGQTSRDAMGKRKIELNGRKLDEWLILMAPAQEHDDDSVEMFKFLDPQKKTIERGGGFFWARTPDRELVAEVLMTASVPGDASRAERRNPSGGADRISREVNVFLDEHLGEAPKRGGTDLFPEGKYPLILRRWVEDHLQQYQRLLRAWVAFSLNGTEEPERTLIENDTNAVRNRAGKLGYTTALLQELAAMLDLTLQALKEVETEKLGVVVSSRGATQLADKEKAMRKSSSNQAVYLAEQERILQEERLYAVVRAARWAAEQMHGTTFNTLQTLQKWDKMLREKLYASVWKGQEAIGESRKNMEKYSAVRQPIDYVDYKAERYRYYTQDRYGQTGTNAKSQILNDLRWQISIEKSYDEARQVFAPRLVIEGLTLGDTRLAVDGGQITTRAFVKRCRSVFEDARQHETLLQWLRWFYNDDNDERRVSELAKTLSNKGKPALRMREAANPYKLAYVRAQYAAGSEDETWLRALVGNTAEQADADRAKSQPIASSDPCRLTFLYFNDLVDVEKLTSYHEGLTGIGGAGGYQALPAVSDGTGLAKQVLHVFAAERNAVVYEQGLGRLLSDKIVALLEDMERFRQFVYIWALGQFGRQREILLNIVQLAFDDRQHPGHWVRRCTTEPFEGEIDPDTKRPRQTQHWWLTEPARERPSLYAAAETFCLRGEDIWQSRNPGSPVALDYPRIQTETMRQRKQIMETAVAENSNADLQDVVQRMVDPTMKQRAAYRLSEYKYLQKIQIRLTDVTLPAVNREVQTRRGKASDRRGSEYALDADLLYVMKAILAHELQDIRDSILQNRADPTESELF